jgi:hypothetical protein
MYIAQFFLTHILGRTIYLPGGGYGFFLKKNVLIPNVAEKNILILVEE